MENRDGFDIDDESVSGITQPEFDGVIQNLRNALDAAGATDGKPYLEGCSPTYPTPADYQGLAGIFNWTMSADSVCSDFEYTRKIAADVGYHGAT